MITAFSVKSNSVERPESTHELQKTRSPIDNRVFCSKLSDEVRVLHTLLSDNEDSATVGAMNDVIESGGYDIAVEVFGDSDDVPLVDGGQFYGRDGAVRRIELDLRSIEDSVQNKVVNQVEAPKRLGGVDVGVSGDMTADDLALGWPMEGVEQVQLENTATVNEESFGDGEGVGLTVAGMVGGDKRPRNLTVGVVQSEVRHEFSYLVWFGETTVSARPLH